MRRILRSTFKLCLGPKIMPIQYNNQEVETELCLGLLGPFLARLPLVIYSTQASLGLNER